MRTCSGGDLFLHVALIALLSAIAFANPDFHEAFSGPICVINAQSGCAILLAKDTVIDTASILVSTILILAVMIQAKRLDRDKEWFPSSNSFPPQTPPIFPDQE